MNSKPIYLISLDFDKLKFVFSDADDLAKILKKHDQKNIDFIKKLDESDLKFKKIAKKILVHSIEGKEESKAFLKNHYFFN